MKLGMFLIQYWLLGSLVRVKSDPEHTGQKVDNLSPGKIERILG